MKLKQLKTENYPDNAIVIDWKINPSDLMSETNAELGKFGLKIEQYETYNDSYCFVIVKTKTKKINELKTVIFYDLEALKNENDKKSFNYHFNLLKGNLKDFFKQYD